MIKYKDFKNKYRNYRLKHKKFFNIIGYGGLYVGSLGFIGVFIFVILIL